MTGGYAGGMGAAGGGAWGGANPLQAWPANGNGAAAEGILAADAHVNALQRQLRELSARHATREAEAAELLESVQRVGAVEAGRVRREMGAALDAKNAEVDAFRCELDLP